MDRVYGCSTYKLLPTGLGDDVIALTCVSTHNWKSEVIGEEMIPVSPLIA